MLPFPRRHRNPWNSAASGSTPYWTQLFNDAETDTPEFLWYYDTSFLTIASGDISGWADAWTGTARDLAQGIAARRPKAGATYAEFDPANTEYMVADFSSAVGSGNLRFVAAYDLQTAAAEQRLMDSTTGRLILMPLYSSIKISYYDGGYQQTDLTAATGLQFVIWELTAGSGTAYVYRNSTDTSTAENYTAKGIGGTTNIGTNNAAGGTWFDGHLQLFGGYSGTTAADLARIKATLGTITGL